MANLPLDLIVTAGSLNPGPDSIAIAFDVGRKAPDFLASRLLAGVYPRFQPVCVSAPNRVVKSLGETFCGANLWITIGARLHPSLFLRAAVISWLGEPERYESQIR